MRLLFFLLVRATRSARLEVHVLGDLEALELAVGRLLLDLLHDERLGLRPRRERDLVRIEDARARRHEALLRGGGGRVERGGGGGGGGGGEVGVKVEVEVEVGE